MSDVHEHRMRSMVRTALLIGGMLSSVMAGRSSAALMSTANAVKNSPIYYATFGAVGAGPADTIDEFVDFEGLNVPSSSTKPIGSFYAPGSFLLGQFRASALPSGTESKAFEDVPFWVALRLFDSPSGGPEFSQVMIEGVLNGELTGDVQSNLTASVTTIFQTPGMLPPPFSITDLEVLAPQIIAPATGSQPNVSTALVAYVPEPSALATLGVGLVVFAFHARRRRRATDPTRTD